jgi:hypothetical protein
MKGIAGDDLSVVNHNDETNLEQSLIILQKFPTYPCSY